MVDEFHFVKQPSKCCQFHNLSDSRRPGFLPNTLRKHNLPFSEPSLLHSIISIVALPHPALQLHHPAATDFYKELPPRPLFELRLWDYCGYYRHRYYILSMQRLQLPDYPTAKEFSISPQGLENLLSKPVDPKYPHRNIIWTDDFRNELPIRLGLSGPAAFQPTTLIDEFQRVARDLGHRKALTVKRGGKWQTLTYAQYYGQAMRFAKALIAFKLEEYSAVNIIGFNAPEWSIAFFGSLFARCIPVGIYTTSNAAACEYIATHSDARMILAENREQAVKYYPLLEQGKIELIVIYSDPDFKEIKYPGKIIQYEKFMAEGARVENRFVEQRISQIKPGHCCTLVYTSGTTGMPKGVMISHDNYVWTKKSLDAFHERDKTVIHRMVSYLPLSHVAGQFADIVGAMIEGVHVFFAEPSALQGTLIQTLQEVKPTMFFSVPRVWEKIYDKMMEIAKENGPIKSRIATWAKQLGPEGTIKEMRNEPTSFAFKVAKTLIFNNVKKALGLDQCTFFLFGAAPLDPSIRGYFLSLNFYLINSYGMSESTGPQNFTDQTSLDINNGPQAFREVGRNLPGTELVIKRASPNDDDGEICYRGRNVFMGYFKNPEQSGKTLDAEGFLHSGDNGKLTPEGVLFITGRAKELIITAGGQNIPPVLIQNQIKSALPFLANAMVVGDMKKFLTVLLTLREDPPNSGNLDKMTINYLEDRGCKVKTVSEARGNEKLKKIISEGLKKANDKAASRAQHIQDNLILGEDFTVDNGLLTPTLKLKRKQVLKKYHDEVEKLYQKPTL